MSKSLRAIISGSALLLIVVMGTLGYRHYLSPTRILIVNPLPAQAAEITLSNDHHNISVECVRMKEAQNFDRYDAILLYGRGLYLDSLQMQSADQAARRGVPIFIYSLRNTGAIANHNLDSLQITKIGQYFKNPCQPNYRNLLRYLRHLSTPYKWGDTDFEEPIGIPDPVFYHLESGQYFERADQLTEYLKHRGIYHPGKPNIAFVSGVKFPVESNRAHIDTLISRLTRAGYNVYPLSASGKDRNTMLSELNPSAVIYLPMGRLGNDDLIDRMYESGIPLFMPFPLIQSHEEWLDSHQALTAGTLNARIVIPEIDGAMTPLCIATQNLNREGFRVYTPEPERIDAFMEQFTRFINLRTKPNAAKKIAIGYFKFPGKDALLASGMEVVPSLYNFLKRLRAEGYNVQGLPENPEEFKRQLMTYGAVMGDYAVSAQEQFMNECHPRWIDKGTYEKWAAEVLLPEKYQEIVDRYGQAPGRLLSRGDSIAIAAIEYGNILLFPQPRPAIGQDEFKLVHGAEVAPPHSYIAPYLYMQQGFDADVLIHFGTHGNLEFTPGKNAALSQADWAEVLVGNRPHFYFYSTGNIGEAVIAKRRSHAVIVSHLTPPYIENNLRPHYQHLIDRIHAAIADPAANTVALKNDIISLGIHRDLGLDSTHRQQPYTVDELKTADSFMEELIHEKITGAYYVMGVPYNESEIRSTLLAMTADKLAYTRARKDRDNGRISTTQLQDYSFITHHYLPDARRDISDYLQGKGSSEEMTDVAQYRQLLLESPQREFDAMLGALSGQPVRPAPGGDPVLSPNVLPTGRNMFSINAEATPSAKAWNDGVTLAEKTLNDYLQKHGTYPHKVSYSFWAGEFIASQGATLAQAFRMLGVEPIRDEQGRVMDLKLTPSAELGRPRINIMVQVSGQLRDIAESRLNMLTQAVTLASTATHDLYPNYVAEGTIAQEQYMVEQGTTPKKARELSTLRVFGPVNSGYSTGMLSYMENSGAWDRQSELVDAYLHNMCALYGDSTHWGMMNPALLAAALHQTDVIVQPRQSNTWGPISLDHVYEFTGSMSLASTQLNGKEPDAVMADYRNADLPRLQDAKEAIALETRATLLNPTFVKERMKGEATTAQMFGKMFHNIFGWSVMRASALNENLYNELYEMYILDKHGLNVESYFDSINPAAYQEMTATLLESARKGYWQASDEQIAVTARRHADITGRHGAPCTQFVCANSKLQQFIAAALPAPQGQEYKRQLAQALSDAEASAVVLKEQRLSGHDKPQNTDRQHNTLVAVTLIVILLGGGLFFLFVSHRNRPKKS